MTLNMSKELFQYVPKSKNLFNEMIMQYINNGKSGLYAVKARGDVDYLIAHRYSYSAPSSCEYRIDQILPDIRR